MDNNINILDELNKGCCMGIDSLNYIISRIDESKFRNLLEEQLIEYKDLSTRITNLYKEYTNTSIHKTNLMTKAMTWYGIEMDTMVDKSISNVADMFIKGTSMGIVEGKRLLNNKTMDKKVKKICKEYIDMQEAYINKLEEYL